jgi:1-deoxy-D-xylulose-5-phosphate reductoisomerase
LRAPPGSTAVLNAANEIAVEAFLAGSIRFDQIHQINLATLDEVVPVAADCDSVDALIAFDGRVRRAAADHARRLSR